MTLRRKAVIIIIIMVMILGAVLYFVSQNIILNSFITLEENYTQQNIKRATQSLATELTSLETTALDWSAWDDTYAFVEDGNSQYISANLVDEAFLNLQLNLMAFVHSSGRIVYAKAFDLDSGQEKPLPADFPQIIGPLIAHAENESGLSGILLLPENPMLIVSLPVLTSQKKGPTRGTLILGRYLDTAKTRQFAEQIQLPVSFFRLNDPALSSGFEDNFVLSDEVPTIVQPLNNDTVAGYVLLKDIFGRYALVLRVDMPRDIYQQGKNNAIYFSIIIVLFAISTLIVLLFILDRQILLRVGNIVEGINRIGSGADLSVRVAVTGKDELTRLSITINAMLESLQETLRGLKESEENYRGLVSNVSVGVVRAGPEPGGVYLEVNPAWEKISGYSREELLRMKVADMYRGPKEREAALEKMAADPNAVVEAQMRRKDGTLRIVSIKGTPVKDSRGQVLYFDAIIEDITELKRVEQERERLYQQEKKLRLELQEEIRKRTEFTRALVHELKTPLTPIMASSELLVEELKQEPWLRLAKNIYEGASNLNRRIDELLDLARSEIGALKLNLQMIALLEIIQEVITHTTPLAAENKQTLQTALPPSLPTICADEDRVRAILLNLINNAIKYTPPGGKITVRARQEETKVVVEIQDTGRGIDEKEIDRLFQPYYRMERDRERLSGLGLGLALSKKFVEMHNGSLWVTSQKGIGSIFAFSLPIDPTKCTPANKGMKGIDENSDN
jgi:PAS domain S-box-containing protein